MNQEGQNFWQGDQGEAPAYVPSTPPTLPEAGTVEQDGPVTWQASEYIHHEKDGMWFLGMLAGTVVLAVISIFLVRSWTFTALIVVMAIAVVVYARRPPRTLTYTLSSQGLQIDDRQHSLGEFRAFGIVQDGPFYSIVLIPVKRFMPSVNVYFPQDQGEKIVDMLGSTVPMERIEFDLVDRLVRKLRF